MSQMAEWVKLREFFSHAAYYYIILLVAGRNYRRLVDFLTERKPQAVLDNMELEGWDAMQIQQYHARAYHEKNGEEIIFSIWSDTPGHMDFFLIRGYYKHLTCVVPSLPDDFWGIWKHGCPYSIYIAGSWLLFNVNNELIFKCRNWRYYQWNWGCDSWTWSPSGHCNFCKMGLYIDARMSSGSLGSGWESQLFGNQCRWGAFFLSIWQDSIKCAIVFCQNGRGWKKNPTKGTTISMIFLDLLAKL